MRKFFAAFLAIIAFTCLAFAAACTDNAEPQYFILTYAAGGLSEIKCEIPSGYEVMEGYSVNFTVGLSEEAVGDPQVRANSEELQADADGVYSFVMKEDTEISVSGVSKLGKYTVKFDTGEKDLVKYSSPDCDTEEDFTASSGDEINFTVTPSIYCRESEYMVLANSTILEPDADGVYKFKVAGDTTVKVSGITEDVSFADRENGGSGTQADPFRIEKPIDLYAMALLVGDMYDAYRYCTGYYILENDIDMEGERLYIIGDGLTTFFGGNFNGNNHTISNYYISDTEVDQETYIPVFMPWIGLFGYVQSLGEGSGEIYDLNLENFSINVNGAMWGETFAVGAIAGIGMGANITNCTASGTIVGDADTGNFGFMGGLIGYQQSYTSDTGMLYYSVVQSCYSDVNISGESGYINGVGGITGYLHSVNESAAAIILNSYSTGNLTGGMNTGGIAGGVSPYSSVIGCYATGNIEAASRVGDYDGYEEYAYAYSGGIAGYLDYDSVISDCFFTGKTYASALAGTKYAKTGAIVGGSAAGGTPIEAEPALILNSYSSDNVNIDDAFIKGTIGWGAEDWKFNGDGRPVINTDIVGKTFTVTIQLGDQTIDGKSVYSVVAEDAYIPMSYWYLIDGGIPEFMESEGGLRTYGYYFDSAYTQKVPYAFVPTSDITLYAAFADYTEVAGEYCLKTNDNGSKVLILGTDGTLLYRDGALSTESYYTYNGEFIILRDTYLAMLVDSEYGYYSFKAEVADGLMKIYDAEVYTGDAALQALKTSANFAYGTYYGEGVTYVFYKDGTGLYNGTTSITYTISDDAITVYRGTGKYTGTIVNGEAVSIGNVALTRLDIYAGTWEKSAGSNRQYTFDGKGGYSYEYFGYDAEGNKIIKDSVNGNYSYNEDGSITLDNGARAGYDSVTGFIAIDDETYYRQYSFAGMWNFPNAKEPVDITLNGIASQGYGSALVNYGSSYTFDASYEAVNGSDGKVYLVFYYKDVQLGILSYDYALKTLSGSFYSVTKAAVRADVKFFLYDDFKGEWISDELELVQFNGLGNYYINGTSSYMAVRGNIKIDGISVGAYTLEDGTLTGSFVYDEETYYISYDEVNKVINVTCGTNSFNLEGRDEWYGLGLVSEDGTVYTFDGRGNLSRGGTLRAEPSSGAAHDYGYKITEDGSIEISEHGSIVVRDNDYILTLDGKEWVLNVDNLFTGRWLVGGTDGEYLEIGKINAALTANGTFLGEDVTFTYDVAGNFLSFEYGGQTLYINVHTASNVMPELSLGTTNSATLYSNLCINDSIVDEYAGTYTAADGSKLVIDGFSNSFFGAGGKAVRYDKNGLIYAQYTYSVDYFGMLKLRNSSGEQLLFRECGADVQGAFSKDGSYYSLNVPDELYTVTAADADGLIYYFDGLGGVVTENGTKYEYEVVSLDNYLALEYVFIFTDEAGDEYTAVLNYSQKPYTISLTEGAPESDE